MPRDAAFVEMCVAGMILIGAVSACSRSPALPVADPASNVTDLPDAAVVAGSQSPSREPLAALEPHESTEPAKPAEPQPVFRPDDRRASHDDVRLKEVGINLFESKHLKLFTDIDPAVARTLPSLIDEVYQAWEEYFGPLPPDRAGQPFQMTGFLIKDAALFRELGLMPEEFTFAHGAHRRNEFWMYDQEFDYFRRHLLIHEATHCFMTYLPGVDAPRWYLEGMAEYFGAHRLAVTDGKPKPVADPSGQTQFRVMPTSPEEFAGFGRISIIRKDIASQKLRTIPAVLGAKASEFLTPDPYAWSWALCAFLDGTPQYHERFQRLGQFTQGSQFPREFTHAFDSDARNLATEWIMFVTNLQYEYDLRRAAIDFQPGDPLTDELPDRNIQIAADRGWQSSRVLLKKGVRYQVTAEGRFTLADATATSKSWESEPQGISFRYFDGQPIGTLLGCLRLEEGPVGGPDDTMLRVIVLGRERTFEAPITGTLYLRLNDAWNSLHDNRGSVSVLIRQ